MLEPLPYADAFWEGGAAAWGRVDAWSDIDLSVLVADGAAEETFRTIEVALGAQSPILHTYVARWPAASGIAQKFYRLEEAGPFLVVDLAVVNRSAPDKFLQPEVHGPNVVYFDKTGATKVPALDREAFVREMRERLAQIRERTELFHVFVDKEMNRGT